MLTTFSVCHGTLICFCMLLGLLLSISGWWGQEPAPSECVLLCTSRQVRKDMKGWVLSQEGNKWSVMFDVRDLGRASGY